MRRGALPAIAGLMLVAFATSPALGAAGGPMVHLCRGPNSRACAPHCSGVLVSPRWVLTARHCVAEMAPVRDCAARLPPSASLSDVWVKTGEVVGPDTEGVQYDGVRFPKGEGACGHDFALLHLTRALPEPYAELTSTTLGTRAVRIEIDRYRGADSVTLERRTDLYPRCAKGATDACATAHALSGLGSDENVLAAPACPGDSGGAAFVTASRSLLGLTTRAAPATVGGDGCGYAIVSGIESHALWIASAAHDDFSSLGTPVPRWVFDTQARGNSGTVTVGARGMPCDNASECASRLCGTLNGGLDFMCVDRCDSAHCSGSRCAPSDVGTVCDSSPGEPGEGGATCALGARAAPSVWGLFLVAAFALGARGQRQRGSVPRA